MDNLTSENQDHREQVIEMTQLSGTGANGRGGDEESQERGSQSNENGRHPLLSDAHPSRMADTSEVASAISNLKNMAKDMVADPMFDPKTISHISESDFNEKKKSLTQNVDFFSKILNSTKDLWEDNDFSQLIKAEVNFHNIKEETIKFCDDLSSLSPELSLEDLDNLSEATAKLADLTIDHYKYQQYELKRSQGNLSPEEAKEHRSNAGTISEYTSVAKQMATISVIHIASQFLSKAVSVTQTHFSDKENTKDFAGLWNSPENTIASTYLAEGTFKEGSTLGPVVGDASISSVRNAAFTIIDKQFEKTKDLGQIAKISQGLPPLTGVSKFKDSFINSAKGQIYTATVLNLGMAALFSALASAMAKEKTTDEKIDTFMKSVAATVLWSMVTGVLNSTVDAARGQLKGSDNTQQQIKVAGRVMARALLQMGKGVLIDKKALIESVINGVVLGGISGVLKEMVSAKMILRKKNNPILGRQNLNHDKNLMGLLAQIAITFELPFVNNLHAKAIITNKINVTNPNNYKKDNEATIPLRIFPDNTRILEANKEKMLNVPNVNLQEERDTHLTGMQNMYIDDISTITSSIAADSKATSPTVTSAETPVNPFVLDKGSLSAISEYKRDDPPGRSIDSNDNDSLNKKPKANVDLSGFSKPTNKKNKDKKPDPTPPIQENQKKEGNKPNRRNSK